MFKKNKEEVFETPVAYLYTLSTYSTTTTTTTATTTTTPSI